MGKFFLALLLPSLCEGIRFNSMNLRSTTTITTTTSVATITTTTTILPPYIPSDDEINPPIENTVKIGGIPFLGPDLNRTVGDNECLDFTHGGLADLLGAEQNSDGTQPFTTHRIVIRICGCRYLFCFVGFPPQGLGFCIKY